MYNTDTTVFTNYIITTYIKESPIAFRLNKSCSQDRFMVRVTIKKHSVVGKNMARQISIKASFPHPSTHTHTSTARVDGSLGGVRRKHQHRCTQRATMQCVLVVVDFSRRTVSTSRLQGPKCPRPRVGRRGSPWMALTSSRPRSEKVPSRTVKRH